MAVECDVSGHGNMGREMHFSCTAGTRKLFDMLHQQSSEPLALGGRINGDVHEVRGRA